MHKKPLLVPSILSAVLYLSFPAVAFADPTRAEQSAKLAEEAGEAFKAHDYAKANEKFSQAYVLDPDPNLLYNQGRCYEATGDRPAADAKYKEFLAKPGGDQGAQKRAKAFVEEFAQNPAGTTAQPPTSTGTGTDGQGAKKEVKPGGQTVSPQEAPEPKNYMPAIISFAVAGGLGVGTLITGLVALSASSTVENDRYFSEKFGGSRSDLDKAASRASTFSTMSDVLLVGTFVAAGVGVYFTLVPPKKGDGKSSSTGMRFGMTPGGAVIGGSF